MSYDEKEAIRNCQAGELEDFGLIYDNYIKKIYNFIYFKTLHKETAEDLTSLTFIKALEKIKQFDPNRGAFSAWLYSVARNNVTDYFRGKKDNADIEDIYDLADAHDLEIDSHNRLIFEEVSKYLNKLGVKQKEILIMRLWEGLAFKEIADKLNMTEANCKMIFYRAVLKLREELAIMLVYIIFLLT